MRSRCTATFWRLLAALPSAVQEQAKPNYRLWHRDPSHPSLRFKRVHAAEPIWSVRISRDHRALGVRDDAGMLWFWIGSHAGYDRVLGSH